MKNLIMVVLMALIGIGLFGCGSEDEFVDPNVCPCDITEDDSEYLQHAESIVSQDFCCQNHIDYSASDYECIIATWGKYTVFECPSQPINGRCYGWSIISEAVRNTCEGLKFEE